MDNHFYHHGCWPVPVFEVAPRTPTDFQNGDLSTDIYSKHMIVLKEIFTFSPGCVSLSSLKSSTFMESLTSLYLSEKKSRNAAKMRLPKRTISKLKERTKVASPVRSKKSKARRVTFRYMSET